MEPGTTLPDKLLSRISIAKAEIDRFHEVRIISHYDADGISSAGVLCSALLRAGKRFHATMTKSLTNDLISEMAEGCDLLILSDMGSSHLDSLERLACKVIVLDHHAPPRDSDKVVHVNPHLAGIDGMTSGSASAVCMLLAAEMDERNWDLLGIAFAGIAGDRQAIRGLSGLNQWLFEEGLKRNVVEVRPGSMLPEGELLSGLVGSTDPYVIGVSGSTEGAKALLEEAGVPLKARAEEIDETQRMKLSSLLALKLTAQGTPVVTLDEVVHERYHFPRWDMSADAFAGLLNACGRSNHEGVGLALALGDEEAMKHARALRQEYVDEVQASLLRVIGKGITKGENIQYFLNENLGLSGILSGVTMQYFGDRDKPTLALADTGAEIKVSSRGTFELLDQGVDLAAALRESAQKVGGVGGGHRIASGATVPRGREQEFLDLVDKMVGEQKAQKKDAA
ncbi:MAG: DHH family protein [Methanomassiliicoccales archaeon PtaB.Bin215]|nr:MAG: DHH family protein [Methanomassiliicoccales archaeon PtaB.Bin215]